MGDRSGRSPLILAAVFLTGCQATITRPSGGTRILNQFEMDQVTAGSALASYEATARALGSDARTNIMGTVSAYFGTGPIVGAPLLNYASSQASASASGDVFAKTGLSSHASVDGANGGASIDAVAGGSGTSRAQVDAQFYAISTNRTDLAFGSAAGAACCNPDAAAQVGINSQTGGTYSRELRAVLVPDTPGQARDKVDVAVVSSALPILDPAQLSVVSAPTRASPKY